MGAAGRASSAAENLPARWIDVDADAESVRAVVADAMARHDYTRHGADEAGVTTYRFGSPGAEFVSDALSLGLVLRMLGRPDGWAEIAVWTMPTPAGVRLTVGLMKGTFHAAEVRTLIVELIEVFRADGTLLDASAPLSSVDLAVGA